MTTHPTDNAPVHDLLPCPFCGSAPYSDEDDSHSTAWEIKCSCGAAPYVWEITKAEAITAWNTRTAPDLAAEVARLRAIITAMQQAAAEVAVAYTRGYEHGADKFRAALETERAQLATQAVEVARLRASNAGLVEVLKPFAEAGKDWGPTAYHPGVHTLCSFAAIDFVRAAKAIANATADQRGPVLDARGVK